MSIKKEIKCNIMALDATLEAHPSYAFLGLIGVIEAVKTSTFKREYSDCMDGEPAPLATFLAPLANNPKHRR